MYICICKAVTDTQINNAISNGACSPKALQKSCSGAGTGCGKCGIQIKQLLDEHQVLQPIMKAA